MTGSFSFPDPEGDDGSGRFHADATRAIPIVNDMLGVCRSQGIDDHVLLACLTLLAARLGQSLEGAAPAPGAGGLNSLVHELFDEYWARARASALSSVRAGRPATDAGDAA